MDPNSQEALLRRRDAATLTWRGPALMLFARTACAVGAQALVAASFALRSSCICDFGGWSRSRLRTH